MKQPARQKGIALLMLLIIIVLAIAAYLMSGLSPTEIKVDREVKTLQALNKAKQALLAYAMNYPDVPGVNADQGPGNFPCPAKEEDGVPDTLLLNPTCNSAGPGAIGYFPWKEIETGDIRDGSGELLWYAVSNNYANFADRNINTSTTGQILLRNKDGSIQVSGNDPRDAIVAVIIAPGEILVRGDGVVQVRGTVAEKANSVNYLDIAYSGVAGMEEDNASYVNGSSTDGFIPGPIVDAANNNIVNDQFVTITYEEIMKLVHARAAVEIGNVINAYFIACNDFPEAAATTGDLVNDGPFEPGGAGPYNSVALSQQGLLPVDTALPEGWDDALKCTNGIKFPSWVKAEGWHLNTFYQYSYTKADPLAVPPVAAATCVQGAAILPQVTCLTVNGANLPIDNKEAVLVFAGREKATQDRSTVPVAMSEYFEVENSNGDLVFDSTEIEDYVHVIAP